MKVAGGKHVLGKSHGRHVFGTVRVGEKGQIVIPKEARRQFNIQPGDTLLVLGDDRHGIIVTRPDVIRDVADQILDNLNNQNEGALQDGDAENVSGTGDQPEGL